MKKHIKSFLKYTLIFIILLIILLGLLVGTAKIPQIAIEHNLEESAKYYKYNVGIKQLVKENESTYLHLYADSVLLNIIYHIDSEKPLESVLWANFYKVFYLDINHDFIKTVEQKTEANEQYLRYWHGSMVILRPLLTIFNIEQIYLLNTVAMWSLAIALLVLIFIKSKKIAIIYIIGMVMIGFPIVPLCIEYSWTFYVMIIAAIIAILIEKRGNNGLYVLSFVSGMITCFLDFLTTEIISMLVPLLLVLFIRKEENRLEGFKETAIFVTKFCVLWAVSYVIMWLSKWLICSIVLNIDAIEYVKDNFWLRVNGRGWMSNVTRMRGKAIYDNFHNLFPLNLITKKADVFKVLITFGIILVSVFDWKNIRKKWFSTIMLIIATAPYVRYWLLASHSYSHHFFTYRNQLITIMAIAMIIIDCFNYKLLFKQIKFKRGNKCKN